jgi:hypothetical protein
MEYIGFSGTRTTTPDGHLDKHPDDDHYAVRVHANAVQRLGRWKQSSTVPMPTLKFIRATCRKPELSLAQHVEAKFVTAHAARRLQACCEACFRRQHTVCGIRTRVLDVLLQRQDRGQTVETEGSVNSLIITCHGSLQHSLDEAAHENAQRHH